MFHCSTATEEALSVLSSTEQRVSNPVFADTASAGHTNHQALSVAESEGGTEQPQHSASEDVGEASCKSEYNTGLYSCTLRTELVP